MVKSASAENLERERFRSITGDYHRTFLKAERLRAFVGPLTETLATVGTVIILWYGARLVVSEGALSGAQFVGFVALSLKLYAPVKYAAKFPALVQPGLAGAERVFEFLDHPRRDQGSARGKSLGEILQARSRSKTSPSSTEPENPYSKTSRWKFPPGVSLPWSDRAVRGRLRSPTSSGGSTT